MGCRYVISKVDMDHKGEEGISLWNQRVTEHMIYTT